MLSGVIFLVLALLWAVFLIPKALRHHDEVARTRSVEVSESARVLARREAISAKDSRLVVGPTVSTRIMPSAPERTASSTYGSAAAMPVFTRRLEARRAAAASAARRRRRILGGLLLVTAVVGGTVIAGLTPAWSPAVPGLLVVGFLILARVTVRRANAAWEAERARLSSADEPAVAEPVEREAPVETDELGTPVVSAHDDTAAYDFAALRTGATASGASDLWDPLPVTLPTYVSKPRASRSVRTIDLRDPSVSSSGRDEADSALVAEAAAAADEVEEIAPPARAVNS